MIESIAGTAGYLAGLGGVMYLMYRWYKQRGRTDEPIE